MTEVKSRRRIRPNPDECAWVGCREPRTYFVTDAPVCDAHAYAIHLGVVRAERIQAESVKRESAARYARELTQVERDAVAPPSVFGHIYYLRTDGVIKIGYALTLEGRLPSYPPTSVLLATHPGTRDDETALHRHFRAHRIAGREWYREAPEISAHIDAVVAEHGEPSQDYFTKRQVRNRQPVMLRSRSGSTGKR